MSYIYIRTLRKIHKNYIEIPESNQTLRDVSIDLYSVGPGETRPATVMQPVLLASLDHVIFNIVSRTVKIGIQEAAHGYPIKQIDLF